MYYRRLADMWLWKAAAASWNTPSQEAAHKLATKTAKCKPDPASEGSGTKHFDVSLHLGFGLAS